MDTPKGSWRIVTSSEKTYKLRYEHVETSGFGGNQFQEPLENAETLVDRMDVVGTISL